MGEATESGLRVDSLVGALEPLVVAVSDSDSTRQVTTVAMVDPEDIRAQLDVTQPVLPSTDLVMLVGVTEILALQWLDSLTKPPAVVMVREGIVGDRLRTAAERAEVVLVAVDTRARWDVVLSRIRRMLDDALPGGRTGQVAGARASVESLSELANLIADGVRGMVTIENSTNRVLAYSPSESTADELRTRAILGRAAPPEVMDIFARWGVVNTLAGSTEVVSLPADPAIGMRRRLVTGIHSPDGEPLGSVWVQQGEREFDEDAEELLRGGAVSAAALMMQARSAPSSQEEAMVRRLLGEDGGVDGRTAATLLQMVDDGQYAVIGFAAGDAGREAPRDVIEHLGRRLQLHVRAYAATGVVGLVGQRAYVLVPDTAGEDRLVPWVEQLLDRFDKEARASTRRVRVSVAAPVDGLDAVPVARREVDRVLDSPVIHEKRVTSLKKSRTSVLLGEVFELLGQRPEFEDPRFARIQAYDDGHGTSLVESLEAYLQAGLNVRDAAAVLRVHPNTLRYRVERVQQLSGLDLADAGDRLLTELQLGLRR